MNFWTYGNNGFFTATGMKGSYHRGIGFIFIIAMAMAFVALLGSKKDRDEKADTRAFSVYSFAASVVLIILSLSIFPWDRIQFMSKITQPLVSSLQFPVRWFDFGTAFATVVVGYVLILLEKRWNKIGYYAGVMAVVISVITSGIFLLEQIEIQNNRISLYNGEAFGLAYISGGEYLIIGTNPDGYIFNNYVAGDGVSIKDYESGPLRAEVVLENVSTQSSWVEAPLAYYKGYRAYSDEGELKAFAGDNEVVRVEVPAGFSGDITVKFVSPLYWRVAEVISLLGYIGAFAWIFMRNRGLKRRVYETEQE